jgi:hypothetical protein
MQSLVGKEQINRFITKHLNELAVDSSGWEKLYINRLTSEYWILTYPASDGHGGGEPMLTQTTEKESMKFKDEYE